jgi:hypothetical protein
MTAERVEQDWRLQEGALIGTRDGDPAVIHAAFAFALQELGFVAISEEAAPYCLSVGAQPFVQEEGGWIVVRLPPATAREIGRRVAARVDRAVWVATARALHSDTTTPSVSFDAHEVAIEPSGKLSRPLPSGIDDIEWDDEARNTDKPWRLVEMALDEAIGAWSVRGGHSHPVAYWRFPPRLESARLEALALKLRAGATAERVLVSGRPALRVRDVEGAVSTAFLSDDELRALAAACPGVLNGA